MELLKTVKTDQEDPAEEVQDLLLMDKPTQEAEVVETTTLAEIQAAQE